MKYTLIYIVLLFSISASACDICGCSAGGSTMGILPQFQKNLAGIRYSYLSFNNPAADLYSNTNRSVAQDQAHTTNLWTRFYPAKRWQVFAFVPYKVNTRHYTNGTSDEIQGLGDASFLVNYVLLNTGDSIGRNWKNTLLIGGGVKLPTGKYRQRDKQQTLLPTNFQIGNGAYTFSVNTIYTVRYKKWGLNMDAFYRANTTNESFYRTGNQSTASLALFYWKTIKNLSVLPSLGLYGENFAADSEYDLALPFSGGSALLINTGLDFYYKRAVISALYQIPLAYQIPSGQTSPNGRISAGISFLF